MVYCCLPAFREEKKLPLPKLLIALAGVLALASWLSHQPAAAEEASATGDSSGPLYVDYSEEDLATLGGLTSIGKHAGATLYRREILSPTFTIDRIYKSMTGPLGRLVFTVDPTLKTPELLWVTAFRSTTR